MKAQQAFYLQSSSSCVLNFGDGHSSLSGRSLSRLNQVDNLNLDLFRGSYSKLDIVQRRNLRRKELTLSDLRNNIGPVDRVESGDDPRHCVIGLRAFLI